MGWFGKKEEKLCPICGEKLKLFSGLVVEDGEICENCENMLRGKFNIEEYWHQKWGSSGNQRGDYVLKTSDPLKQMTIAEIQDMIQSMKEEQKTILENVGTDFDNVAKVDSCFTIAPKALQVGMKRAKEYKNRYVATAQVISGTFAKGDQVTVTTRGNNVSTQVLDVFECSNSSTFDTILQANMGSHSASAGTSAWIILDLTEGVEEGSLIQK